MTKKEKINRNIGLTFDFLRQVAEDPSIIEKIPNGAVLEFIEKDFPIIETSKQKSKKVYLKVTSKIEVAA